MAMDETVLQKTLLDALTKASKDFDEDGAIVTHFVCIAEIVTGDGEYYLTAVTDADSRPWLQDGMIAYAQANGLFGEDDEEYEEEDDDE